MTPSVSLRRRLPDFDEPSGMRYCCARADPDQRRCSGDMVGIAQLVEHLVVVQDVAGSSPVTHPTPSPFEHLGLLPVQLTGAHR